MESTSTRRTFLASGVAATLGVASVVGRTRGAAAETAILSGRIVPESGADVGDDQIQALARDDQNSFRTDDDGWFEAELDVNAEYKIGYYKSHSGTSLDPVQNGVPHVYGIGREYHGSDGTDLGEVALPQAHRVDFRVLDGDDEPIFGSKITYRHSGWGTGPNQLSLDEDGYARLEDASFTGIELAESARVEVEPPQRRDFGDDMYKHRTSVTGPTEFAVRLSDSGADWEVSEGDDSSTGGDAPSTGTSDDSQTTTGRPSQTTTEDGSGGGTGGGAGGTGGTNGSDGTDARNRGFFSNGPDAGSADVLSDPFYLTVGGFVLSAAGIAHQMLRGY